MTPYRPPVCVLNMAPRASPYPEGLDQAGERQPGSRHICLHADQVGERQARPYHFLLQAEQVDVTLIHCPTLHSIYHCD